MLTQPDIHLETARHRIRPSCRPISSLSMRQRVVHDQRSDWFEGLRIERTSQEASPVRPLPDQSTPVRLLSVDHVCVARREGR